MNRFDSRIRVRRASSTEWMESNPVLGLGEIAYETDSRQLKVGNDITAWSGLDYVAIPPSSINYPEIFFVISDGADPRTSVNLSSGEYLKIVGSGDTNIIYDPDHNGIIIDTQSGSEFLTKENIIDRLGYTPQISGSYSSVNHMHSIADVSGLNTALASKQNAGNYAAQNHTHTLSIGDGQNTILNYYNNIPLNIVGSGYSSVLYNSESNTVTIYSIGNSGVTSFNNRTGSVNLSFPDVTGALNYVPQPLGSYALSGHKHHLSDILDVPSPFVLSNIPYRVVPYSSSSGNPGDVCWDLSYLYVCVGTNSWKRLALNDW